MKSHSRAKNYKKYLPRVPVKNKINSDHFNPKPVSIKEINLNLFLKTCDYQADIQL
jgi:hypothetical protein